MFRSQIESLNTLSGADNRQPDGEAFQHFQTRSAASSEWDWHRPGAREIRHDVLHRSRDLDARLIEIAQPVGEPAPHERQVHRWQQRDHLADELLRREVVWPKAEQRRVHQRAYVAATREWVKVGVYNVGHDCNVWTLREPCAHAGCFEIAGNPGLVDELHRLRLDFASSLGDQLPYECLRAALFLSRDAGEQIELALVCLEDEMGRDLLQQRDVGGDLQRTGDDEVRPEPSDDSGELFSHLYRVATRERRAPVADPLANPSPP